MSSEWKSYQLADLATFKYGKFLAKSQLDESGFPVFSGYGVVGYLPTYQFDEPQLLIVCRGEGGTGDVKMSPHKCSITNLSIVFSPNEQIVSKKYLYWALKASDTHRLRTGSAQAQIVIGSLEKLWVSIPPDKTEQDAIARTLDALDDRIALLRETNATLEGIAQAMFKSWFVDFDPVHAKQQGRAPEGMSETAAALFPDSFEDSELGLVPSGWRWSTLNDAYEINPQRKLKKGEIAPYLDMANAPTSGHSVESVIQREMGSGSKFTNGDTLLARITPCLENGKTAFVDFLSADQNGWGSTEFIVLRPRKPLPEYHAYLLARHKSFRDFSIQSMSGTSGRQRIQNDVLGKYLLALPTEDVATAFGDIVTPIQKRITENNAQAQTLATLRDTLLPRLISGQLRIPVVEGATA